MPARGRIKVRRRSFGAAGAADPAQRVGGNGGGTYCLCGWDYYQKGQFFFTEMTIEDNLFSSICSLKSINIRLIRIGSQPYLKIITGLIL